MKFKIELLDGQNFWSTKDKSLLNAALEAGVNLNYSCKDGRCGVCKTKLISGTVSDTNKFNSLTLSDVKNNIILTCSSYPTSDIYLEAENLKRLNGISSKILPCRIDNITNLDPTVIKILLRLPPNAEFKFLPGQFIDIIGPKNVRRSYSIASTLKEHPRKLELLIRDYPNGLLSKYWFREAKVNDLLRFEGPLGTFYLRETNNPNLIFLATGTGIAPIKSIIKEIITSQNIDKYKNIRIYFGFRKKSELFFNPNDWFPKQIEFIPVISREKIDGFRYGYVQEAVAEDYQSLETTDIYACGSIDMINSARKLLISKGLIDKNFHSDAFLASGQ